MRIGHNMHSMKIFKNYNNTLSVNSKALENISSGSKLNSSKDNPGKVAQADNLKLQILAREASQANIQDTNSMLQTFDGALQEMNNNINRLTQLTVKMETDTNNEEDKEIIQKEISQVLNGLEEIANNTSFNGVNMCSKRKSLIEPRVTDLNRPSSSKISVMGSQAGEKIEIPFYDLSCKGLGLDDIDFTKDNGVKEAMEKVENATKVVSKIRSKYGSLQSRLEDTNTSMEDINLNLSNAQSSIIDSDIAEEMLNYAKTNIIYQSAVSLMAQSNKFPQDVLNILSNVK